MTAPRALGILVGGLAAAIIARSTVVPSNWHFVYNVALAIGAIGLARSAGLGTAELGLARDRVGSGVRLGGLAFAAISVVLIGAAGVGLLDDDRTAVDVADMLVRILVIIPLGTVVVEELIFRGALDGLLTRVTSPSRTYLYGAVLFGSWHIPPILGDGAWAAVGTLVVTTAAGVGFVWLRHRSGSIVAPMLAHLATNSVTFAVSWIVGR